MSDPTGAREALDLLPCPFCGNKAAVIHLNEEEDPCFGGYLAQCKKCFASSAVVFPLQEPVETIVAEKWNRRALQAGPQTGAPATIPASGLGKTGPDFEKWWDEVRAPGYVFGITSDVLVTAKEAARAGWAANAAQGARWMPQGLVWTKEKPKVGGWYWHRYNGGIEISKIRIIDGEPMTGDEDWSNGFVEDCEFLGPIPEPVEAIKEGGGT